MLTNYRFSRNKVPSTARFCNYNSCITPAQGNDALPWDLVGKGRNQPSTAFFDLVSISAHEHRHMWTSLSATGLTQLSLSVSLSKPTKSFAAAHQTWSLISPSLHLLPVATFICCPSLFRGKLKSLMHHLSRHIHFHLSLFFPGNHYSQLG